jgi:hypothetical protein
MSLPAPTGPRTEMPLDPRTCTDSFEYVVNPEALRRHQAIMVVRTWPLGKYRWAQRYGPYLR